MYFEDICIQYNIPKDLEYEILSFINPFYVKIIQTCNNIGIKEQGCIFLNKGNEEMMYVEYDSKIDSLSVFDKALSFYEKAATLGNLDAMLKLRDFYVVGYRCKQRKLNIIEKVAEKDIPRNKEKAILWNKRYNTTIKLLKIHQIGYYMEYKFDNGDIYNGEYKTSLKKNSNGEDILVRLFDGQGSLIMGNYKYVGEFQNDKIHGKGVLYFKDKVIREGLWYNDRCAE